MTLRKDQSEKPENEQPPTRPSFEEWCYRRYGPDYEDGEDDGGHISIRMTRRWDYEDEMARLDKLAQKKEAD